MLLGIQRLEHVTASGPLMWLSLGLKACANLYNTHAPGRMITLQTHASHHHVDSTRIGTDTVPCSAGNRHMRKAHNQ